MKAIARPTALPLLLVLCASLPSCAPRKSDSGTVPLGAGLDDRTLAVDRVPAGASIKVDGRLDEWGVMGEGYIDQQLDHHSRQPVPGRTDCAVIKMMRDEGALYFAIRVVDNAVYNPHAAGELWRGDTVALFLDVRPVAGKGPLLGDPHYSDGVFSLAMAAPGTGGGPVRLRPGRKRGCAPLGKVQVAGRRLTGGYALEARLPFESLNGAKPGRFSAPIGFEVSINDSDGPPDPKAKKKPPKTYYSWGGGRGCSQNPGVLSRAAPRRGRAAAPFVRAVPPRVLTVGEKQKVVRAALVTARGSDASVPNIRLIARFYKETWPPALKPAGGRAKAEKAPKLPSRPRISHKQSVEVIDRPELGLRVEVRSMEISDLALGRYYFRASFPGTGLPEATTRMYHHLDWRGRPRSTIVRGTDLERGPAGSLSWSWMRCFVETPYSLGAAEVKGGLQFVIPGAAAQWQLSKAALEGESLPKFRVDLCPRGEERSLWNTTFAPGAREPRFTVPTAGLAPGSYELRVSVQEPSGRSVPALAVDWNGAKPRRAPLVVCRDYGYLLRTKCADASKVLSRLVKLGDPYRKQFPKDDARDSFARSIWDMQLHAGRIYLGCGDWNLNVGPIDVFSFAPQRVAGPAEFRKEVTVAEESVDVIREYEGKLFVPGIDSRESWKLGNLYVKSGAKWTKHRTVPNGIHVLDAAPFKGKLYTTTGTETGAALYESADGGRSWKRFDVEDARGQLEGRYYEMLPLKDCLLVTGSRATECAYRFAGGRLQLLRVPLLPGLPQPSAFALLKRTQRFRGGAVYTIWLPPGAKGAAPLFFLKDPRSGAVLVELFHGARVRDVLVRNGKCYVLTGTAGEDGIAGEVFSSADLKSWVRLARFKAPALPVSMEMAGDRFYLGLGARARSKADPASGTIWVLAE
jgi:hypothetical protein